MWRLQPELYRPDIDGLRAIAVWLVVIFHFFPHALPGGFIGVDVFFVISGYLITALLLREKQHGGIAFINFYQRRIRRIFPALIVVLAASLVIGWWWLLAREYALLGKHIAAGAVFMSNFAMAKEVNYFATESANKLLLHLWSLAVEEQFYLLWPLLLGVASRRRIGLVVMTLVIGGGSFIYAAMYSSHDPEVVFYLPQARAWELMMGALLALFGHADAVPRKIASRLQSLAGAGMLVTGACLIHSKTPYPGGWALLPTVGTALLIRAGADAWLNRRVLASPVLVYMGWISYPLYLWHWPLLAFLRLGEYGEPDPLWRFGVLALSCVLAWLTFVFVEQPFRRGGNGNRKAVVLIMLMGVTGWAGYACYRAQGMPQRAPEINAFVETFTREYYVANNQLAQKYRFDCDFYYRPGVQGVTDTIDPTCHTRDAQYPHAIMIWGDSHAQHYYEGLRKKLPAGWQLLQIATSSCPPTINAAMSISHYCAHSNMVAMQTAEQAKPDVAMVAMAGDHEAKTLHEIADKLISLGVKKVIIVGQVPFWTPALHRSIVTKFWGHVPRRTFTGIDKAYIHRSHELQKQFPPSDSIIFANIADVFCNEQEGCMTYLGDDTTNLTAWDYGHLTPAASEYVADHLLVRLITGETARNPQE